MKPLCILGAARSNGNTKKALNEITSVIPMQVLDLADYTIGIYNYENKYSDKDQFFEVEQKISENNHIVFATPVYWYGPSTIMKIFIDRLQDMHIDRFAGKGNVFTDKYISLISSYGNYPHGKSGIEEIYTIYSRVL